MKHPVRLRRPQSPAEALFVVTAIVYALLPLGMELTPYSFLGYRAAPNENFRGAQHEVLQTRRVCKSDECDNLPEVWRDRRTSEVFRRSDFFAHRRAEARRMGWSWFAYSLIGALGFALPDYP